MITQIYELLKATSVTGNVSMILIFSFLAGVVTSFTPCVYPMIPITIGILQANGLNSLRSNFLSALLYVFGMATVYAVLGYVAATGSLIFGQWAVNPWVNTGIIIFFLYLAFSMLGFYDLHVPRFLTHRTENISGQKSSLIKSFLFGVVTGTVASPCLTPPLAILLGLAAKTANPLVGFGALFMFAFGMGILLLIVGTFSASLNFLPRAGVWLDEVKRFFGFVMLGLVVYFAQPRIPEKIVYYLYGFVVVITFFYYVFVLIRKLRTKTSM